MAIQGRNELCACGSGKKYKKCCGRFTLEEMTAKLAAYGVAPVPEDVLSEMPLSTGNGWFAGNPKDYDRTQAIDVPQLFHFLQTTQPEKFKKLGIADPKDVKDIARLKFLARLSNEIGKRGLIDVLRKGVSDGALNFDLFYGTPSPGNAKSAALFSKNRFIVTRQLRYSTDETRRALDLCLFINGLPVATFELKNSLTKQTVEDAVEQYRRDRDPREKLFQFGRCVVHFAVDDAEVAMCSELRGKGSWFPARARTGIALMIPYSRRRCVMKPKIAGLAFPNWEDDLRRDFGRVPIGRQMHPA